MTHTFIHHGRPAHHLPDVHHVDCGGIIATDGVDHWCTTCLVSVRLTVRCEVYSRIVGYLRPLQNWAPHKAQEFKDRQTYTIPAMEAMNAHHTA